MKIMNSTKLSTILSRMDRWQTVSTIEEQYKVRDLDDSIRSLRRTTQTPWSINKSTIRIFRDVLEYPIATDHDYLMYLNTQGNERPPNFYFTSTKEFYENPDYRNDLAEIWDSGTRFLGIRYENFSSNNITIDTASTLANYTGSDDVTSVELDTTMYKEGNSSIQANITNSTDVATVTIANDAFQDVEYLKKYYFINVYLGGLPTSVDLRIGTDSSNYLTANVTTQFSGQALKANNWNLLAFNLNEPDSTVGTIDSNSFAYSAIVLNAAPTGAYYINYSYLREWNLMDYSYYSLYNIKTASSLVADQEFFFNSEEAYALDSELIGDKEWIDVIMYDAILLGVTDKENSVILPKIKERRDTAWQKLLENYPSEKPLITTRRYNYEESYNDVRPFNS